MTKDYQKQLENEIEVDTFTLHYMIALMWSERNENEDEGEFLDTDYTVHDVSEESKEKMKADCKKFLELAKPLLEQVKDTYSIEQAGHDFALTRNHHGTGFWDREELKVGNLGDKLTEIAQTFKETSLYAENGKVELDY